MTDIKSIRGHELRAETDARIEADDRAWIVRSETCVCQRPVPGPRYSRRSKCVRCDRWVNAK